MPAVLTHKAILLLARDRLVQIRDVTARMISRKIVAGAPVPMIEQRMNALADAAVRMMNTPPFADVTMARARDSNFGGEPDTFAGGISKFAILGCMGPDLPAFAEVFRPGQGWVFDTVHKGTPDYNREAVIAGTTDMALAFRTNAFIKIREAIANPPAKGAPLVEADEMRKVNAYVLGHICHLAGDIVAHPLINDLEWHLGIPDAKHASHGTNEAIIDAAVARRIFRRASTREGQGWGAWWPTADEVPAYFGDAYADAFRSVYGTDRPRGFKDFENDLARFGEPALNGDFMRSGVKTFRGLVLTAGYDWGYGHWFGLMTLATVPLMFMPLIAYGMPYSRQFFEPPDDPAMESGERQGFEMVTLPFQLGSLSALVYAAMLQPFARGAGKRGVAGIVMQAITLASLIVTSVDSGAADRPEDGIPAWARWLFITIPIAGNGLVYSGLAIADKAKGFKHPRPFIEESPAGRRQLINMVNLLPLAFFLIFFAIIVPLVLICGKIFGGPNERAIDRPGFWVAFALHALGVLALWLGLPVALRDKKIPEHVQDGAFALRRHAVRLFDDATLFDDPAAALARVRYYPSDIRPLARLWWEGAGEMQVRSDRYGLVFKHSAAAEQTVTGPMAPMTVAEYLQFLRDSVKDGDGNTGTLAGAVFDAEAIAAYLLPSGAAFAGHGDLEETKEDKVQSENAKFRTLGSEDNDKAYVLYHAPKPEQAVKGVPRGTIRTRGETALRTAEGQAGYDYLINIVSDDPKSSDALIAKAADLGALLCMGAADHLSKGVASDDRVYQVFRNWSLDRRRVNEWRMLVEGGALSEKTEGADSYDPAMPQGLSGPILPHAYRAPVATADPAVLAEAEATARSNGWIKTLRDWLTSVEEGENLLATTQSRPNTPTNRALSRALAYMFDATDPAGGP